MNPESKKSVEKVALTSSPQSAFTLLQNTFQSGLTHDLAFRESQIKIIRSFVLKKKAEIESAWWQDFRRLPSSSSLLPDIDLMLSHLRSLSSPKLLGKLHSSPSYQVPSPKGAVLVFGPSNFPIILSIRGVVSALAAGNCVALKPSEYTPACERLLTELAEVLDPRSFAVVTGDVKTAKELMTFPWDHVFFTGSSAVGKLIMHAAAKHLTPVTLELGGKNPCIVAKDTDIPTAAMSIVQGRFINAGQICLAPEYCLVEESIADDFCNEVVKITKSLYGPDPKTSPKFSRLIPHHVPRVCAILSATKGEILTGGHADSEACYIEPTIVRLPLESESTDALMEEEIFGPILTIIAVPSIDHALSLIQRRPIPLCVYLFTRDKELTRHFVQSTRSGSVGINETIVQTGIGKGFVAGVGQSGMGGGVGKLEGFHTLSHQRVVFYGDEVTSTIIRGGDLSTLYKNPVSRLLVTAQHQHGALAGPMKIGYKIAKGLFSLSTHVLKAVVVVRILEKAKLLGGRDKN